MEVLTMCFCIYYSSVPHVMEEILEERMQLQKVEQTDRPFILSAKKCELILT